MHNQFIFTFMEYDLPGDGTGCYFGVLEDGSLIKSDTYEEHREKIGHGVLGRTEIALAKNLLPNAKDNQYVWKFRKDNTERLFVYVFTPEAEAYFDEPEKNEPVKWKEALVSLRWLKPGEYEYYVIEPDPEEIFFRQLNDYNERDREGDEGYDYDPDLYREY